jgi:RimJ/RimL family protein N-acetyltransferase
MDIVGSRVDLRPFTKDIIAYLYKWHQDPEFDATMSTEIGPKSEIDLKAMYDRFLPPSGRLFVVTRHGEAAPIGVVAFGNLDLVNRRAEIFGGLGDRRGEGLGVEAMRMMMDWGIANLGLQRIYANVVADNRGCLNMLANADFKKEAEFKNEIYRGGRFLNRVVMGYNLASTLPLELFKTVTEFVKKYKENTGKNIHGGHLELLNAFCEYVRKTGGDD